MTRISGFAAGTFASDRHAAELAGLKADLGDLNRQLATGKRAQTLGGYGSDRQTVLAMRARAETSEAYSKAALRGEQRLALMTGALGRMSDIARAAKADALKAPPPATTGAANTAVLTARGRLSEAIGLLNSDFDGQYLFAGRGGVGEPAISAAKLLDGEGGAAGLRTLIEERRLADIGDGRGRLVSTRVGAVLTLSEEAAGLPFGFKLDGVRAGSAAISSAGPSGSPPSISLSVVALPAHGEAIAIDLKLPDGSVETIAVTASANAAPTATSTAFAIGADAATTAANLEEALDLALRQAAPRQLAAASALTTAVNFIESNATTPAQRIAGPPFDVAMAFAAPGSRSTVEWYLGDQAAGVDARASQIVSVDEGLALGVGARADEPALRDMLAGLAALAAETVTPADAAAGERLAALTARTAGRLGGASGQSIEDISADLASASASMSTARARHVVRKSFMDGVVAGIETVSLEELSASILSLQTRLQASYQATASLSRLSLADYLR